VGGAAPVSSSASAASAGHACDDARSIEQSVERPEALELKRHATSGIARARLRRQGAWTIAACARASRAPRRGASRAAVAVSRAEIKACAVVKMGCAGSIKYELCAGGGGDPTAVEHELSVRGGGYQAGLLRAVAASSVSLVRSRARRPIKRERGGRGRGDLVVEHELGARGQRRLSRVLQAAPAGVSPLINT
jgi:hypothetical protein